MTTAAGAGYVIRLEHIQAAIDNATADERPALSKAAVEAVAMSSDANREIDRLLTRKCNRAESAEGVIKEILAVAREDMKAANTLDNWIADDDPTKPIHAEAYWKRRRFVDALRAFLA